MIVKCTLDEDDCINLLTVLRVVSQIDQEQAWAICYGMADLMKRLLPLTNCAPIDNLAQIHLHKDGFIHEKSCLIIESDARELLSLKKHPLSPSPSYSTSTSSPASPSSTTSTSTTPESSASPTEQLYSPTTANSISSSVRSVQNLDVETTLTSANYNHHHINHHHHHHHQMRIANSSSEQHQLSTTASPPQQLPPTPPITPELRELLRRRPALNEYELVASLGIALFWALDYGIPNDEERKLNRAMECLIFQSQNKLSLSEVLELCIDRLPMTTKAQASLHYRGVCKTLVSDTIELSMFLEKIYTASMVLSDITLNKCLDGKQRCDISDDHDVDVGDLSEFGEPLASLRALRINDWARLWMQVIRELRQRGKFKQALLVN